MLRAKRTDILLDLGNLDIDYAFIVGWKLREIVHSDGEDAVHYQ